MADSDVHEAMQLDGDISALVSPTVSELWRAMHGYTAEATGAVAAKRALSGGGGSSPLQLLGPYTKGHALFTGAGGNFPVKLVDLTNGTLVLAAYVIPTASFDGTNPVLNVGIAPTADLTNASNIVNAAQALEDTTDPAFLTGNIVTVGLSVGLAVASASLIAFFSNNEGMAPTVGSADFYVPT
jgi:hypothetical protein